MEKNFNFKDIINAVERYWQENEFDFKENENPVVIFLAGQSASGKGQLKNEIDSNFLIVDVDDFRKYHPDYFKLYRKYGKESAKYTHEFASKVADELIKKEADLKVNILVDGTLKSFEKSFERAKFLNEQNYVCEIRAVVTKPEKSSLANLLRYEELIERKRIPRLAPPEVHDQCVKNFPSTITKLFKTGFFKQVLLFNRNRELIYHSDVNKESPKQFIEKEFKRKWKKEEYSKFLLGCNNLINKMLERKADDIEIEIAKAEIKELTEKINPEPVKKQKNKLKIKEKGTKILRK